MSRQKVTAARIGSHQALVYRTSAHARSAASGLIGFVILAAVGGLAALSIWPDLADQVGATPAVDEFEEIGLEPYALYIAVAAALLALASLLYAVHRFLRWRLQREINRLSGSISSDDPRMLDPGDVDGPAANGLPPPHLEWMRGPRRQPVKLRRATPTTNIAGWPRLEIVYLRLFDNEHRHVSFVRGAWREFGTVSMLRSAVSVTRKEVRRARHVGIASLFVTSRERLEAELAAVGSVPQSGIRRIAAGPTTIWTRDRFGAYPMRSVLCANATWRAAVDRLIDAADLVAVDLSGYTPRRAGTRYEIQRVLDRVPAERLLFLADPVSKPDILEQAIFDAWNRMSPSSPNAQRPDVPIWITRVDKLVKTFDRKRNMTTVELETSRRETRRLLSSVQPRLHGARPIGSVHEHYVTAPSSDRNEHRAPIPDATAGVARAPTTAARDDNRRRSTGPIAVGAFLVLVVLLGIGGLLLLARDSAGNAGTSVQRIEPASCGHYVVQLGAFADESAAERRAESIRLMLSSTDTSIEFGWLDILACSSAEPSTRYRAAAGPFADEATAVSVCRSIRAAQAARGFDDLAGYRRLDGDFMSCA